MTEKDTPPPEPTINDLPKLTGPRGKKVTDPKREGRYEIFNLTPVNGKPRTLLVGTRVLQPALGASLLVTGAQLFDDPALLAAVMYFEKYGKIEVREARRA